MDMDNMNEATCRKHNEERARLLAAQQEAWRAMSGAAAMALATKRIGEQLKFNEWLMQYKHRHLQRKQNLNDGPKLRPKPDAY